LFPLIIINSTQSCVIITITSQQESSQEDYSCREYQSCNNMTTLFSKSCIQYTQKLQQNVTRKLFLVVILWRKFINTRGTNIQGKLSLHGTQGFDYHHYYVLSGDHYCRCRIILSLGPTPKPTPVWITFSIPRVIF